MNSINRSFFESLWVEISNPFQEKVLVNISYCPNKNLTDFFFDEITSEISAAFSQTDNIILFGDYNTNIFEKNGKESLEKFASNSNLKIVNETEASWTNGSKSTLIDHCLTSKHQVFQTITVEQMFGSDHFTKIYLSSLSTDKFSRNTFFARDTSNFSRAEFNKKIANAKWNQIYMQQNANCMFQIFLEKLENILNELAPIKIFDQREKTKKKKWVSSDILRLINEKHRLFNLWKEKKDLSIFTSYKIIRNSVNRQLKKSANEYSKNIFENITDSKQKWKFIKNKLQNGAKSQEINKIRANGEIVETKKDIANTLNNCFAKLGLYKGENEDLALPNFTYQKTEFSFRPITRKELYDVIDKLPNHKSAGPGYIPAWCIKSCKMSIGTHLQFVINECILQNIFPDALKKAYITPIYKKGDPLEAENYRPISVTPTLSKIFERLILQQMMEHVIKNEIINKHQFGFQKGKSSNDTVIILTEKITELLEKGETVMSIFLDLAKAFNSISHELFVLKITKYGFGKDSIEMLKSFLSNRKQCVKNGTTYSDWTETNHGVPQGTVLGPLVFILYVNDFREKMGDEIEVLQFADDTSIICHSKTESNLLSKAEIVFRLTDQYMRQNQLTLNRDKTEIIIFKNDNNSHITEILYDSNKIKIKDCCRYLGIMIDRNLQFHAQLNKMLAKMATAIRSIYLVRHQIPLKARIILFKSLVLSHLNFSAIFLQSLTSAGIQRINRQINWGVKVCYMRKKFDHSRDILLKEKLLPAELMITKISLYKMFDILLKLKPKNHENHSLKLYGKLEVKHNDRTGQLIFKNKSQSKWSERSVLRNFVQKWNNLPNKIRKENSKNKFKEKIKNELIRRHEMVPIDRKLQGFKHYFYK